MEEESSEPRAIKCLLGKEKTPEVLPPARPAASTMRKAVKISALVTGVYSLISGCIISSCYWQYDELTSLVQAMMEFSFITTILNAVIIFSLLKKDNKALMYTLCATIAVHMVALPFSACGVLGIMLNGNKKNDDYRYWEPLKQVQKHYDVPFWEMPRFFICLLHLALMYCLLAELRGDPLPPLEDKTSPPPEAGCLKNNLARSRPPQPAAEALLKLKGEQNNLGGGGATVVHIQRVTG